LGYCAGERAGYTWVQAQEACPTGSRLPTREELTGVLEGCEGTVLRGEPGMCRPCQESEVCRAMFSVHDGDFWTSSVTADGLRVFAVSLERGTLMIEGKDARHPVRCVKAAEPAAVLPR
jgi:hypothetical protein